MKVLVLGGTGFLSSAVVAELQQAGHAVTVYTRGQRGLPAGVDSIAGDRKNVADFLLQLQGRPFDAVVDCICYTPEDAAADLRAFAGRTGHLVMISTDFVYGPHRRLPMDEDTPTPALSQYGRNKAACEALLLGAWAEERFPVTILRPPHIMGAGGHLGTGSLQGRDPMLLDRLLSGAPVILLDGGALLIQPVVHRDIGRACAAVLGKEATWGQAYNVAGPDCITTREYYDVIAATLGVEHPQYLSLPSDLYVRANPDKAPFAYHRMYSVEKLYRDAGYRPDTGVRHAIFEMIDWLQATGSAQSYDATDREEAMIALWRTFESHVQGLLTTT